MRKFVMVGGVAGLGCVLAGLLWAEQRPEVGDREPALAPLMLAKLASSQRIVRGLVSEDFTEIRQGATELQQICEATAWKGHADQIYAHHRTELRRQTGKLLKMADEKNLDGAAFTYMQSLTTCISCHQYCRDVLQIADETLPPGRVVPIPVTGETPRPLDDRPLRR